MSRSRLVASWVTTGLVASSMVSGGGPTSSTCNRASTASQEVPLNWNKWVRQTHRWLSIAFTVAVIVNIVALGQEEPAVWVYLLALLPLALLLFTGLYLFVLPYATKWRSGRRTD